MIKFSLGFAKEPSKALCSCLNLLCYSQTRKVHVLLDALLLYQQLASESLGKQQTPEGMRE